MAISAIFLMVFLLQHFLINITSVFSESLFNSISHFMGTNPLVQFILQPILIAGVLFHFGGVLKIFFSAISDLTNIFTDSVSAFCFPRTRACDFHVAFSGSDCLLGFKIPVLAVRGLRRAALQGGALWESDALRPVELHRRQRHN